VAKALSEPGCDLNLGHESGIKTMTQTSTMTKTSGKLIPLAVAGAAFVLLAFVLAAA
jgi:hypothetical protein